MDRSQAVAQLKETWSILSSDLDEAAKRENDGGSQYAKRALVRAFFAQVEGLSFQLRQVTLASLGGTNLLTEAELQLLREVRSTLDEKGSVREVASYLNFPASVLFSMRVYAKNHGATFNVDRQHTGWFAFKRAADIRNHVTHPKSAAALQIVDEQLQELGEASAWWQQQLLAMFAACHEADDYWRRKLTKNE